MKKKKDNNNLSSPIDKIERFDYNYAYDYLHEDDPSKLTYTDLTDLGIDHDN